MATGLVAGSGAAPAAGGAQSYIVVLHDGTNDVPAVAAQLAQAHGGQVGFVYQHAIQGFSVTISSQGAAALARNPRVAYVEADQPRSIDAQTLPTGIERIFADDNANIDIDGSDDFRVDVDVAVIDTGVDFEHPELNVVGGVDCASGGPFNSSCSPGGDDDHYHGTHVAGTIAAFDNGDGVVGVAPGARIHAVKVLNQRGSGYVTWIVAGIDWVAAQGTIEVANMSLGGSGFSQAEYDAIQGAVEVGVAFAVAAGNSDADARNYSPAAFDNVLTVSALADFDGEPGALGSPTCRTDQDDTLADFSNWGPAVDIAAPGVCILSTFPIEQGSYGTISGTSMASPHAAGALALLASVNNPGNATDVHNLYSQVVDAGNLDWTDDSGDGTKERLLDVTGFAPVLVPGGGGGGGGDTTAPAAPTGLTADAGDAAVALDWVDNGESDLAGYNVYRSTTSGSGYERVNTGLVSNSAYTDSSAVNGTTFYYVVTAVDASANESGYSSEASATPQASGGGITLSVTAYKVRGVQHADLSWSGASGASVDVYRNASVVETTANDGLYTDTTGQKGGGSATYQVCEAGTDTCSNEVTANW